jgi:hypothetical protein
MDSFTLNLEENMIKCVYALTVSRSFPTSGIVLKKLKLYYQISLPLFAFVNVA